MKIRPILLSDIEQVVQLENKAWTIQNTPAPLPLTNKNKIIQRFEKDTHYLIAEKDGNVLGVLHYEPYYSFPSGHHVVTFGIAVDEKERKKGVGRRLIKSFLEEAKEDYQKVQLHILATNQEVLSFFENLGFTEEARLNKQFFLNGQYVDDLIYTLYLS
ncbi:GNAT family N-acetyltransferase [Streptococcus mutans]|nr:GNAT family N-acetyltransferase [Streptococcus mutans]MCB4996736.1 GNAT family N-acetyltransferase [Streptococcus mutans]MCB5064853.1 GNAT family N-acetyltransferase [Streptococcus mutans]MCB5120921.1 GNAT family N-acetyltransferase [Streptococcus mutans]MCB5133966.1 GNAT family N-acetyltransferase [Streptococcus mutans]